MQRYPSWTSTLAGSDNPSYLQKQMEPPRYFQQRQLNNEDEGEVIPICSMSSSFAKPFVVGLVIARQPMRRMPDKKNPGMERGVMSFVLRDSPEDTITVQCWGSPEYLEYISGIVAPNSIVSVAGSKVQERDLTKNFGPRVSSSYELIVSEKYSTINAYEGELDGTLSDLIGLPLDENHFTLREAVEKLQECVDPKEGFVCSLLVIVAKSATGKEITSKKDSKILLLTEVELMDDTYAQPFILSGWSEDFAQRAKYWREKDTTLFVQDVKVFLNSFSKRPTASLDSRSIIFEYPRLHEAQLLFQMAKSGELDDKYATQDLVGVTKGTGEPDSECSLADVSERIAELQSRLAHAPLSAPPPMLFTTYASFTDLRLSGWLGIAFYCPSCKKKVNIYALRDEHIGGENSNLLVSDLRCTNLACASPENPVPTFRVSGQLSDTTGSLLDCVVTGDLAELLLSTSAAEFLLMSDDAKHKVKMQALFNLQKITLQVSAGEGIGGFRPLISVIGISQPLISEYSHYLSCSRF